MRDAISNVLQRAPWLIPVISWTIAALVVLLLLALPAYLYLLPLFRRLHAATAAWVQRLQIQHKANREDRQKSWIEAADSFRTDNLLKRIREGGRSIAAGIAVRVKRQLRLLRRRMAKTAANWISLGVRADKLSESLRAFSVALGVGNQPLPDQPQMQEESQGQGVAWLQLVIGLLLLLGMVAANTVMLSQILRDLGFIPPSYTVFGVPLVYFLALLLSLLEAGLGFWHSTALTQQPGAEHRGISFVAWFVAALALFLALFEGQNYAAMSPDRTQKVILPFINYGLPKADSFFLLGFAIVWTLFGLGGVCYRAGKRVVEGTAPVRLLRQLRRLRRRAIEYDSILRGAEEVLGKAKTSIAQGSIASVDAAGLEQLKSEIDRIDNAGGEATVAEERDLTRTEVVHLSQQSGFWIAAGLLAVSILTLTGLESFSVLAPSLEKWLAWVLAIGEAIVFLGAGMLFSSGETVAKGETGAAVESPLWSTLSGVVLLAFLSAIYVWVLFVAAKGIWLVWTCNFIFGVFLFAVGSRLQPLLGVATLFFRAVTNVCMRIFEALWRRFAELLNLIALALEYVAEVLARPILIFVKRDGGKGQQSRADTAAAGSS